MNKSTIYYQNKKKKQKEKDHINYLLVIPKNLQLAAKEKAQEQKVSLKEYYTKIIIKENSENCKKDENIKNILELQNRL